MDGLLAALRNRKFFMQINKQTKGSIIILEPIGDMGLYNLAQLRGILHELRTAGNFQVLIDMGKVPGIDSMSIGFLIQETGLFKEHGGELKLVQISASVRKSFRITETLSHVDVYDNFLSAFGSFRDFKA
jgi:anti-anti-sigma factor